MLKTKSLLVYECVLRFYSNKGSSYDPIVRLTIWFENIINENMIQIMCVTFFNQIIYFKVGPTPIKVKFWDIPIVREIILASLNLP